MTGENDENRWHNQGNRSFIFLDVGAELNRVKARHDRNRSTNTEGEVQKFHSACTIIVSFIDEKNSCKRLTINMVER